MSVRISTGGRRYGDRGAAASEYMGVIVVVAALLAVLMSTGIGSGISDRLLCAISSLTGGTCEGGGGTDTARSDKEFEPPLCTISTVTDKAGSKMKLGWFEWGNEYGFQDQVQQANYDVNEDGEVDAKDQLIYTTFTQAGSLGVGVGAGGDLGDLGEAEVELSTGIKVKSGDTWVFRSQEEADRFREDLETLHTYEMRQTMPGGAEASMGDSLAYWIFDSGPLKEVEDAQRRIGDKLDDRHISYGSIGTYGEVSGGLSIKAGSEAALGAGVNGTASINSDVLLTTDEFRNTKSYTYSVKADGEWGASADVAGHKDGKHYQASRSATVTITRDQDTGELTRIDFTRTTETGASGTSDEIGGDNGKKGEGKRDGNVKNTDNSGASNIEVHTNTITFPKGPEGDADRAVAQAWLDGGGDGNAPLEYMLSNNAPTKRPGADDPFGRLLFDEGRSSRTTYDGMADAQEYGFELNLGISIGASVSMENKSETLADAEFLGAPRAGERAYVPYSYCAN